MSIQNDSQFAMNEYGSILSGFDQITLTEMDNVQLMSRMDTKFVFNLELFPEILQKLALNYRVLNVNGHNITDYHTLYYDTDDFLFYNHHRCGKGNRSKVRYRTYVQSDLHFFEIKNKNNKDITFKTRLKIIEDSPQINKKSLAFYHNNALINDADLKPKLWANYARITLVNKTQTERLTLDLNLHFKNDNATKYMSNIVIAELKQEKRCKSAFTEIIKSYAIKELSISKYCLGVINLYQNVKQNNFKPKLLTLKKINHELY
ncbi:MAG: polyphosphate polymerase domain-containing protein [Bacteroidetes bacterium]|nr:polyphosphate polymerase domain-containing protein [Bacteroidota bacterium]